MCAKIRQLVPNTPTVAVPKRGRLARTSGSIGGNGSEGGPSGWRLIGDSCVAEQVIRKSLEGATQTVLRGVIGAKLAVVR